MLNIRGCIINNRLENLNHQIILMSTVHLSRGSPARGKTVRGRNAFLPCGKTYSGTVRKVNKLLAMHKKVCKNCKEAETLVNDVVSIDNSYTANPDAIFNLDSTEKSPNLSNKYQTYADVKDIPLHIRRGEFKVLL